MSRTARVLVALARPAGYEDVHADLVAEDAMQPGWPWELLSDEGTHVLVAIERPEGYGRVPARSLANEAVRPTWPTWSLASART